MSRTDRWDNFVLITLVEFDCRSKLLLIYGVTDCRWYCCQWLRNVFCFIYVHTGSTNNASRPTSRIQVFEYIINQLIEIEKFALRRDTKCKIDELQTQEPEDQSISTNHATLAGACRAGLCCSMDSGFLSSVSLLTLGLFLYCTCFALWARAHARG